MDKATSVTFFFFVVVVNNKFIVSQTTAKLRICTTTNPFKVN